MSLFLNILLKVFPSLITLFPSLSGRGGAVRSIRDGVRLLLAVCLFAALTSCEGTEELLTSPTVPVSSAGTWTDIRDGHTYGVVRIGEQEWLTENLAYYLPTGTAGGCFTWGEKEGDYTLEDITLDPDTIQVTLTDSLYALAYEATIADPAHDWQAEDNVSPATLRSFLTEYYALYGQDAFTDVMAYYPHFHTALLARLDSFCDEARSAIVAEIVARQQALVLAHRDKAEASNGNYSAQYGYLYSLDGARAAVPAEGGWRLPSDADWKKLEESLGLSVEEQDALNTWRGEGAGTMLRQGGVAGFETLFGGCNAYLRNNEAQYIRKGQCAYFWTNDESTTEEEQEVTGDDGSTSVETFIYRMGIIRQLAIYSPAIWRGTTRTDNIYRTVNYSVRLVRPTPDPSLKGGE